MWKWYSCSNYTYTCHLVFIRKTIYIYFCLFSIYTYNTQNTLLGLKTMQLDVMAHSNSNHLQVKFEIHLNLISCLIYYTKNSWISWNIWMEKNATHAMQSKEKKNFLDAICLSFSFSHSANKWKNFNLMFNLSRIMHGTLFI